MNAVACREFVEEGLEGVTAEAVVADQPYVLKNVKILGYKSRHGRRYTDRAMQQAVSEGMFEYATINRDHKLPEKPLPLGTVPTRSVDDALGFVKNVRHVPGDGLRADAHFTVKDRLTASVMEAAKQNPRQYGFSPVNLHTHSDSKNPDGTHDVLKFLRVHSVDLVSKPATTGGLYEGEPIVSNDTTPKPTIRQKLAELTRVTWEKNLVTALEGQFVDVPADDLAGVADAEGQIKGLFRQAETRVLAAEGIDSKTKLTHIDKLGDSLKQLLEGPKVAQAVEGVTVVPVVTPKSPAAPTGIGSVAAIRLCEKHKVPVTSGLIAAAETLTAEAAEGLVVEFAGKQAEVEAARKQIVGTPPKSVQQVIARQTTTPAAKTGSTAQAHEGGATVPEAEKPWKRFATN